MIEKSLPTARRDHHRRLLKATPAVSDTREATAVDDFVTKTTSAHLADIAVVVSSRNPLAASHGRWGPGDAHFSLHLSAGRFLDALAMTRIQTNLVTRPEIYGTETSRVLLVGAARRLFHIAVGDYAALRVLKGAYNVAYVAWEYDTISGSKGAGASLWKSQLWVLGLFDEIWVGARFVKEAFERHGLRNVHVIPAPIPALDTRARVRPEQVIGALPAVPLYLDFSSQDHAEQQLAAMTDQFANFLPRRPGTARPATFLTIVNPGDARKNSEASILGFAQFAGENPNALLIVKLVCPGDLPLGKRIWRTLRIQLNRLVADGIINCDNILFVSDFLAEQDLLRLVGSVDFYLSTSFAEGLNLPVLEAMSIGTIVISPIHTAMKDYLTPENCVVCACEPFTADGAEMTGYPIGSVTCHEASPAHVAEALGRAVTLNEAERKEISRKAREAVIGRYDMPTVARRILERIEASLLGDEPGRQLEIKALGA